jgi:membrane protein DedA with SNARE-associated domain
MDTQRIKHAVWSWEAVGAFCCFSGGIGAALLGTVLTAIAWMLGPQMHPWLHGLGTALLIVTIPLLIFSGYCLDWEEQISEIDSES